MRLTFEITKTVLGDSEVLFLIKCVETNQEKALKSPSGIGQWIMDQYDDKKGDA